MGVLPINPPKSFPSLKTAHPLGKTGFCIAKICFPKHLDDVKSTKNSGDLQSFASSKTIEARFIGIRSFICSKNLASIVLLDAKDCKSPLFFGELTSSRCLGK